ncbi:hypothetical protein Tsumi_05540 [Porphyromonas miyakawae]|uniref:Uncharacterized protein n=1 Tax=Porphyromonas miyakawae TaxID=3137470 RepID=A0ABQ0E151_9PORP
MRKEVKISMVGMIFKGDVGRLTNAFFIHMPFLIGILASEKNSECRETLWKVFAFSIWKSAPNGNTQKIVTLSLLELIGGNIRGVV